MAQTLVGLSARLDAELSALRERMKECEDRLRELEGAGEGRSEGEGSVRPPVEFIPSLDDDEKDSGETADVTTVTDQGAKAKLLLPGISSSDKDKLGLAGKNSLDMKKVIALVKAAAKYRGDNAGKLPARLAGLYITDDAQDILRLSVDEETVLSSSFEWYEALLGFIDKQGNALKDNLKGVEPYEYDPVGAFNSAQAKLCVKKVVKDVETAFLTAKEGTRVATTARGDVTAALLDKLPKVLAQSVKAVLSIAGSTVPPHVSFKDVQLAVATQFDVLVERIGQDGSASDFIVKAPVLKKTSMVEAPKDAKVAPKPMGRPQWSEVVMGDEDGTGLEAGGWTSPRGGARGTRGTRGGRGGVVRGARGGGRGRGNGREDTTDRKCYNCGRTGHMSDNCKEQCKWFKNGECKKGNDCPLTH